MHPSVLKLVRTTRAIFDDVRQPPYARPGHYLSPRTGGGDISRAQVRRDPIGIDVNEAAQLDLIGRFDLSPPDENRFSSGVANRMLTVADGALLRGMLLHHKPARILEIGSGYSTAVALDVADTHLPDLRITCVEPNADRLRGRLRPADHDRVTLVEQLVQDSDPAALAASVGPGDFVFIDSSHVSKAGSDVNFLLFYVLPLLPIGVHVHVHDIPWPFEYSDEWLAERRDWNEAYLLHAFLIGNTSWRVELWGDWLRQVHPDRCPPLLRDGETGSIWIERTAV